MLKTLKNFQLINPDEFEYSDKKYRHDLKLPYGYTKLIESSTYDLNARQAWIKKHKPRVYEKMMQYPEKLARGEGIPIIQFQYDYLCNFDCEHCCIDKFYVPRKWEEENIHEHTFVKIPKIYHNVF